MKERKMHKKKRLWDNIHITHTTITTCIKRKLSSELEYNLFVQSSLISISDCVQREN